MPLEAAVETAWGGVGGILGASVPDVLDPPTSPNHRALAHGLVPAGGSIAYLVQEKLAEWQATLRHWGRELRVAPPGEETPLQRFLRELGAVLCLAALDARQK